MEDTPRPSGTFLYQQLEMADSVRLCVVQPGEMNDPIVCDISTHRLSTKISYEAVSYTWGKLITIGHVKCNEAEFPVTENLLQALRQLRFAHTSRTIWIDQICINQKDLDERAQQVRIMRDIYYEADSTLIWLGEASQGSDDAMELIPRIVSAYPLYSAQSWLSVSDWPDLGLPPITDPVWIAFGHLMRRPWFHRTWTLQEAAISRNVVVICGDKIHPWSLWEELNNTPFRTRSLLTIPENLTPKPTMADEPPEMTAYGQVAVIKGLRRILLDPKPGVVVDVSTLFSHGRQLRAKEPRDKVFALLRLTSSAFQASISKPDYRRSVREIYLEAATKIIVFARSLNILYSAGCSTQQHDLPSWVPDWSVPVFYPNFGHYGCFSASGRDLPGFADTGDDPAILQVRGRILSLIALLGNSFRSGQKDFKYDQVGEHFLPRVRYQYAEVQACCQLASQQDAYPTGEDPATVFKQTIVGGTRMTTDPMNIGQPWTRITAVEAREDFDTYKKYSEIAIRVDEFPEDEVPMGREMDGAAQFFEAFDLATSRRVFCITEDGYMGLVPNGSKPGDHVGVILGCDVPFVLRRVEGGWKLVGEGYIHGLMDGEAIGSEEAPVEDIWLI